MCAPLAENLSAYDCLLRGMSGWHDWTQSSHDEALLFYRAIKLNPEFARPYALAAGCHLMRKANGWIIDRTAGSSKRSGSPGWGQTGANQRSSTGLERARVRPRRWRYQKRHTVVDHALLLNANLAPARAHDVEQQRLIKTLPRKGIRFVGIVREEERPVEAAATSHIRQPPKPSLTGQTFVRGAAVHEPQRPPPDAPIAYSDLSTTQEAMNQDAGKENVSLL